MNTNNKEMLDVDRIQEYNGPFCCQYLDDIVNEEEADYRFIYNPMMREYYIKSSVAPHIRMLRYCAWCKTEFPKSVREELFYILENEYGIDPWVPEQREKIPTKFLGKEWWRERGL